MHRRGVSVRAADLCGLGVMTGGGRPRRPCTLTACLLLAMLCRLCYAKPHVPRDVDWIEMAQSSLRENLAMSDNHNVAKNVILFLGDGMSVSTVTAARIYAGQLQNSSGEEGWLAFDKFPHVALSKTYNTDQQVPDSAGTATAFLSGVKAPAGVVGVNDRARRGRCDTLQGNRVQSILDWSLAEGKSVGIVTTTRVTHATPSAAYAHSVERKWESDADLPADARGRCDDIAKQLVVDNPDIQVILGGGRAQFLPVDVADPEHTHLRGKRTDRRHLIHDWVGDKEMRGKTHRYVWNATAFNSVRPEETDYLLGLFEYSHMQYDWEREKDQAGEPSLSEMTRMAIEILAKNPKGFFLLVEGGRIDHGHHDGAAKKALSDTLAFAAAVDMATRLTPDDVTLYVVTADHSHTMTIGGYPSRGNPILGFNDNVEDAALDLLPYTSLAYANGPGYSRDNKTGLRHDLTSTDTGDFNFRQQSAVPTKYETHGGDDVAIYAKGAMAHLIRGVQEQHYIAHALAYASCVGINKEHCENNFIRSRYEVRDSTPPNNSAYFHPISWAHIVLIIVVSISYIL